MKRRVCLSLFTLLLPLSVLRAEDAESAWIGDYAAALDQKTAPQRINAMLDCASSSRPRAKDARRWIISDLQECEYNAALARRLTLYWNNHPEDFGFGDAVSSYLRQGKFSDGEFLPLLRAATDRIVWKNLTEDAEQSAAANLISTETSLLLRQGEYGLAEDLLLQNRKQENAPQDTLRRQQMGVYLEICQREELQPPFKRDPSSRWEKKKAAMFQELKETEDSLDENDSALRLFLYQLCDQRLLKPYALKLKQRFPHSEQIHHVIIFVALEIKDAELLQGIVSQDHPISLLFNGKYEELDKRVEKASPEEKAKWKLKAFVHAKKWNEAVPFILSLPQNMMAMEGIFQDSLRVFQHTGSPDLWKKLREEGERKKALMKKNEFSPSQFAAVANELAYSALLHNIDLPKAEEYLTFSLNLQPNNSSFLDSMAYLRYRQGRFSEAKPLIQAALRQRTWIIPPEESLLHAAQIEWRLTGDREKCRNLLNAALRFAAENPKTELLMDEARALEKEIR